MRLNGLKPADGSKHPRKRVGRGIGSGHGKTSGRGHKGQGALAGWSAALIFEGGASPLIRRIPKRGFNNAFAKTIAVVNVGDINDAFEAGAEITIELLRTKNLAKQKHDELKILGNGELTKKFKVVAHRFSKSAIEKIQKAGGEAVVLPGTAPVVKGQKKARKSS